MKNHRYIEILDTTLRDGEQTPGVSFTPAEKLELARLLISRLKIDRLEIGSARVSEGERDGVVQILNWAAHRDCLDNMEILGFADGGRSVDWIVKAGGRCINLLAKGSEKHCLTQLRKNPARHFSEVEAEITRAAQAGLTVNLYLEDWSNGMRCSFHYVYEFLNRMRGLPVRRFMLPDTLGILNTDEVSTYFQWLTRAFPEFRFDFHGHNDYGMVTANSIAAVQAGANGIHTTVNGLGERAGNQPLAQFIAALNDMTSCRCRVPERELAHASETVQGISGKRCAWNTPVVGADVFTQTCGVHADGDKKGELYCNALLPERFNRKRIYALGKLSGKASLEQNLDSLGICLTPEIRQKVLAEIVRLGDKKKTMTPADLPYIVSAVMRTPLESRVKVIDFEITTRCNGSPKAKIIMEFDGERITASSSGDGGYDAFSKALRKCMRHFDLEMPRLLDYQVTIPPGGKTDALVETTITWGFNGKTFVTNGVDSDQVVAAVNATEKMLNAVLPKNDGNADAGTRT